MTLAEPDNLQLRTRPAGAKRFRRSGAARLTDDVPKLKPVELTVSYNGPRRMTVRSPVSADEEGLLVSRSNATFLDTSNGDVWFSGRYAGMSWHRDASSDETIFNFVDPAEALDGIWATDPNSGSTAFGVGGFLLQDASGAIARVFSNHSTALGREGFRTVTALGDPPSGLLPVTTIRNQTLAGVIRAILQHSPAFRWVFDPDDGGLRFYNVDSPNSMTPVSVSMTGAEIISGDISESSEGRAGAVRLIGQAVQLNAIPLWVKLIPAWRETEGKASGKEKKWARTEYFRIEEFLSDETIGGTKPPLKIDDTSVEKETSAVYREWKIAPGSLGFFQVMDRNLQTTVWQRVEAADDKKYWIPIQYAQVDWDSGRVVTAHPVTRPISKGKARDTERWDELHSIPGAAKPPDDGDLILTGFGPRPGTTPGVRLPATNNSYMGEAWRKYGLAREAVFHELEPSRVSPQYAGHLFRSVSTPVIFGSITLAGIRTEFRKLGTWIRYQSPGNSLGLGNTNLLVTKVVYNFDKLTTTLTLSTDLAPFTTLVT